MKIAWLIQNLVPYHHAKFEAFSDQSKHEAHLIQVTNRDAFNVLEFEAEERSYSLHTLFPRKQRNAVAIAELKIALNQCLESIEPDCVCVSGWGLDIGQLTEQWALKRRIPVVMCADSTIHDEPRVFWKEWIKSRLVKAASSALVAGSPHKDYICALGMNPEAVSQGYDIVDNKHFSQSSITAPCEETSWSNGDPYFFVCARFEQKKNIPMVVRAFAAFIQQCKKEGGEPCRLVIVGDGELRGEIEAEIARVKMQEYIHLTGVMNYNQLPWMYQNCQAFIHASTTEQWGLVVNEAMAGGAPVLISERCGCAPDLVHNGENGFQIDPYNEAALVDTMLKFHDLSDYEKKEFGSKSVEIIDEWGPERFANSMECAIDKAMKVGPRKNILVAQLLLSILLKRGSK